MSSWASYTTSQNHSFLNCKNRIFVGALWNWQGMVGKVVDVAHFACLALLLSSRVSPSLFYGTARPTHFRIDRYPKHSNTSLYIMFPNHLPPCLSAFVDSVQPYGLSFYSFVYWVLTRQIPTDPPILKITFPQPNFCRVIFSCRILSQQVAQIYFIVHNSLYCDFTHIYTQKHILSSWRA